MPSKQCPHCKRFFKQPNKHIYKCKERPEEANIGHIPRLVVYKTNEELEKEVDTKNYSVSIVTLCKRIAVLDPGILQSQYISVLCDMAKRHG